MLLAIVLAQALLPAGPEGPVYGNTVSGPFFSAFTTSGVGVPSTPCACQAWTGTKGQSVNTTRNSIIDCNKGGTIHSTGILTGEIVQCPVNTPRIVQDVVTGRMGLEVVSTPFESSSTWVQGTLKTDEVDHITWTCGEAPTANAIVAPNDAGVAEKLNDTSGAAQRCCTQSMATTSLTRHEVSAYFRGESLAAAQVKLTGTGNSAGDCTASVTTLDGGSWSRVFCDSSTAYTAGLTAVTISVCVGTTVGETGSVYVWRPNWVANKLFYDYPMPSVFADGTAVNVPVERNTVTLPAGMSQSIGSVAASFVPLSTSATAATANRGANLMYFDSSARAIYSASATSTRIFDGSLEASVSTGSVAGTMQRWKAKWSGSTLSITNGGTPGTATFDGTFGGGALTSLDVGYSAAAVMSAVGILYDLCADNTGRCYDQ